MVLANHPIERKPEVWQNVNAEPYVHVENVTKSYGGVTPVKDITLSIYKNELFALLGQSGCGKTTLLRILAGLEMPSQGKVFVDGVDITNMPVYKRPVNIMFQSYALFPHLNVYDNIAFGLKQDRLSRKVIHDTVKEALSLVQLSGLDERMPDQLSGGQRQRVALARSFVKRPKLLLLDEPLAALDKKLREQTQFELVNIQERVGITFILVTHDQEEAMTMATRMAIMEDGKIKQIGVPHDIYEFPNSRYVAEFIGNINLFNGIVIEHELDHVLIESPEISCYCYAAHAGAVPIGSSVTFAVRPEKIMISTLQPAYPRNWAQGTIKEIAYLGDVSIYYVQLLSGKVVIATLPNLLRLADRNFQWEDVVYLYWRSENSQVLTV
ncbi:MAG: polyamine ABC transporter ATP-binding protein [Holosporales bacterium]|jgi:putrescine transport system ATP-binding protein|nr:polyamine ABC transporter ATP-binding protein [Holosporales bacterium]